MAIPVARVHLAMAHAALPGLLPTPPRCMMLPLLPAPPCAVILPSSPPRPSRADAAGRWDAHKIKQSGGSPASSSPSAAQCSLDRNSSSLGRASTCESWVSNKKKSAGAATSSSSSSSSGSSSGSSGRGSWSSGGDPWSSSSRRSDSEERWDAHKKPASPASSWSSSASSTKTKACHINRRPNSRASSSSAERWDAHKKLRSAPAGELDDGESSTGSNDVELDTPRRLPRSRYAGPGFIKSPEPSMLPMPSFMKRVA